MCAYVCMYVCMVHTVCNVHALLLHTLTLLQLSRSIFEPSVQAGERGTQRKGSSPPNCPSSLRSTAHHVASLQVCLPCPWLYLCMYIDMYLVWTCMQLTCMLLGRTWCSGQYSLPINPHTPFYPSSCTNICTYTLQQHCVHSKFAMYM